MVMGYTYTHERKPRCRAIAFRRKTTFVTNKEVMRAIKIKQLDVLDLPDISRIIAECIAINRRTILSISKSNML